MSNEQKSNGVTEVAQNGTPQKIEPKLGSESDYYDADQDLAGFKPDQDPESKGNSEQNSPEEVEASDSSDSSNSSNSSDSSDSSDIAKKPNTETGGLNRWLGTPTVRFSALATCVSVLVLGGAIIAVVNTTKDPEPEQVAGSVSVPKTKVGASAIVNDEQAAHIRAQQIAASEKAAANGETYLPSIVTVGNEDSTNLAPPTQPGLKTPEISNERTYKDSEGKVYTTEEAVALLNTGRQIEGVTKGKGSIIDVNINSSASNSNIPRNAPTDPNEIQKPSFEPHVVKPYTPNTEGTGAAQSEMVSEQAAILDKSAQDVDAWQDQYLAMRLKKANMINQKTQVAFSEQVTALEKVVNVTPEARAAGGSFSTNTYAVPVQQKEQQIETASKTSKENDFKPLIYAGESFRAILKNEVNTDNGSEVIAVLQGGPFKGSTIMGTVVKTSDNIQFSFNRLLRKGKSEINISAVGRQIGTNSSGMADDIKKHYLVRYSALVASSALSGVGKSYEQTSGSNANITGNGTVVTSSTDPTNDRIIGNAVGELGNEISDEVKSLTQKQPTYITNNGKIFNVFFNQNVLDNVETTAQKN